MLSLVLILLMPPPIDANLPPAPPLPATVPVTPPPEAGTVTRSAPGAADLQTDRIAVERVSQDRSWVYVMGRTRRGTDAVLMIGDDATVTIDGQPADRDAIFGWFAHQEGQPTVEADRDMRRYGHVVAARFASAPPPAPAPEPVPGWHWAHTPEGLRLIWGVRIGDTIYPRPLPEADDGR